MPRDALPEHTADTEMRPGEAEDNLYCVRCGALVTKGRWRIRMNGDHEHVVFNPAGVIFRVFCFKEAPGARPVGGASGAFTWFPGYRWRIALCAACGSHLGWMYEGAGEPRMFFGIVASTIGEAPRA